MMYMHYCKYCNHIHTLNGHRYLCPGCDRPLTELSIHFLDYFAMTQEERDIYQKKCQNEEELKKLSIVYRMHKYSKWYKKIYK